MAPPTTRSGWGEAHLMRCKNCFWPGLSPRCRVRKAQGLCPAHRNGWTAVHITPGDCLGLRGDSILARSLEPDKRDAENHLSCVDGTDRLGAWLLFRQQQKYNGLQQVRLVGSIRFLGEPWIAKGDTPLLVQLPPTCLCFPADQNRATQARSMKSEQLAINNLLTASPTPAPSS